MTSRLLIRDEVTADAIDDALAARGCRLINVVQATEQHPAQMIFATSDRRAVLHLVQDSRLGVRYLAGLDPSAIADLEALAAALRCWSPEEIDALVECGDEASRARAPGLAALLGDEGAAERVLRAALDDPAPAVRGAALVAATYLPAAALGDAIQALAERDPDDMVRLQAARISESLSPEVSAR